MRWLGLPIALTLAALTTTPTIAARAAEPDEEEETESPGALLERARLALEMRGPSDPARRLAASAHEYEIRRSARLARRPGALVAAPDRWVPLGPADGAGRMTAVAPHPSISGTLYAGAAGGGVFRTTDGGASWVPLTDDLPNLSVGAVAVAPSAPDTLYVGTGEGGLPNASLPGIGLVKSTDGGSTWILPSSAVATRFFRISVHPRSAEVLVAGTDAGGLRSTDGGTTWTRVIAPAAFGFVSDLVRDPARPETLYAATWCPAAVSCSAGPARILKSTDDGLSWAEKRNGITFAGGGDNQRLALAISPTNPLVLYAACGQDAGGVNVAHVYKSVDGAESWRDLPSVSGDREMRAYMGGQSWYDNVLAVSPFDSNVVLAGGVFTIRSFDGGQTFAPAPFGGDAVHPDIHDLRYQGGTLYVATDGGVFSSPDDGRTALARNAGLATRQYYALAQDPLHADRLLAGAQDNGTDQRIGGVFRSVVGSDGFDCAINPRTPEIAYATAQYGRVFRSSAAGAADPAFADITPPYASYGDAPAFRVPLTLDPSNPARLLAGASRVYASLDGGSSWAALGTATADGSPWSDMAVTAIAVARTDPGVLLVAKGQSVYRSTNGGQVWVSASRGLPGARVNGLEIDPRSPAVSWAAVASGSGESVYLTTDGGASWAARSAGLPAVAAHAVRVDPTQPSTVLCGTDVGVFRSTDAGLSWARLGDGLPSVGVTDLRALPDGSALRVATYGRGLWELPLPAAATGTDDAPRWLLAGMAYSEGLGGTFWQSDFSVFNPDPTRPMTLSLAFLDGRPGTPPPGSPLRWLALVVAPRETRTLTNVLGSAPFSLPKGSFGAILVRGDDLPAAPVLAGRTYNTGSGAGTYGLSVPAVPLRSGLAPQSAPAGADTLIGLGEVPGARHTNLILANLGPDPASAEVTFFGANGAALGAVVRVDVAPWSVRQLNRALAAAPPDGAGVTAPVPTFGARVRTLAGGVFPYATVIDDKSSDPVVVTPPSHPSAAWRVPGIVRTRGLNGTLFLSDVVLHNPSSSPRDVLVTYSYQASRPGAPPSPPLSAARTVTMSPGQILEIDDFVAAWLATGSSTDTAYAGSTLDVVAEGEDPFFVFARTYNAQPRGNVGFQIPGYAPMDGASSGGPNRSLVLTGLASNASYRTNVAFFLIDPSGSAGAQATVKIVDGRGRAIVTRPLSLEGGASFAQWNDADLFGGVPRDGGLTVIVETTGGISPIGSYATVIDNVSGDAILVPGQPGL